MNSKFLDTVYFDSSNRKMKKQRLYIFYSERNKSQIHDKLMRSYMNCLCINEKDQSDIIEIHQVEEAKIFHDLYFLPHLLLFVFQFVNAAKTKFWFTRKHNNSEIFELYNSARKALIKEISFKDHDLFRPHFIFALPIQNLNNEFVKFLYEGLTPPPDLFVTFLDGSLRNNLKKMDSTHLKFTIGDDIELLISQLSQCNRLLPYESESLSRFQNSDESFMEINCERNSYSSHILDIGSLLFSLFSQFNFFIGALLLFFKFFLIVESPYIDFFTKSRFLLYGLFSSCKL